MTEEKKGDQFLFQHDEELILELNVAYVSDTKIWQMCYEAGSPEII